MKPENTKNLAQDPRRPAPKPTEPQSDQEQVQREMARMLLEGRVPY